MERAFHFSLTSPTPLRHMSDDGFIIDHDRLGLFRLWYVKDMHSIAAAKMLESAAALRKPSGKSVLVCRVVMGCVHMGYHTHTCLYLSIYILYYTNTHTHSHTHTHIYIYNTYTVYCTGIYRYCIIFERIHINQIICQLRVCMRCLPA